VFTRIGLLLLGVVVLGSFMAIVLLDMWFEVKHWRPLGELVASWSRRYPLFSAGLALVFGAMLGHFFWP
jgi:hypothetical protein